MYEPTKKRRVAEDVAKVFPKEVTNQIFDVIAVMNKAKQIVTAPVAIAFSDDYTDDEMYAMIIQGNLAPAQDFRLPMLAKSHFWVMGISLWSKISRKQFGWISVRLIRLRQKNPNKTGLFMKSSIQ